MRERAVKNEDEPDAGWVTSTAHTDDEPTGGGGDSCGVGNVVMIGRRTEAAGDGGRSKNGNTL